MSKVFDTVEKKNIAISTALKRGLVKNPSRFKIPLNKVIIPDGKKRKMITTSEATMLFRSNKLKLHQIIGTYDVSAFGDIYENDTGDIVAEDAKKITTIKQDRQRKREKKKIEELKPNIIRYVLKPADKKNSLLLYNFLKNNKISGPGRFIVAQNGRVLFDKELNINNSLSKWWNLNNGHLIGMIDSNKHAWIFSDDSIYINNKKERIEGDTKKLRGKKHSDLKTSYKLTGMGSTAKYEFDTTPTKKEQLRLLTQSNRTKTVIYWSPYIEIPGKKIYQTFRTNNNNTCFFDVIEKVLNEKLDITKSERSKILINTQLNHISNLKIKYKSGVPEKELQNIANKINLNFEINDIFNNNVINVKCNKNSRGSIKFLNTYLNHVDKNNFTDNRNIEIKIDTIKEMNEILVKKIKNKDFCYFLGTADEPRQIMTQEGTYIYDDKVNNIIKEFNKSINICDFSIDYIQDKKTVDFLRLGVNYKAHCSFHKLIIKDDVSTKGLVEYDLKSAYAQYKKCKQYMKFPTNMTPEIKLNDWNVKKCIKYLGYYKVLILSINDDNTEKILNELGFKKNNYYVLSSPEIKLYDEFAVEFKFISGSYSFTSFDFDLTPQMLEKVVTKKFKRVVKSKPYAIWAGKLGSIQLTASVKTYCDRSLSELLASKYENLKINDFYNEDIKDDIYNDKDIVQCNLIYEKKNIRYLGHVGGFVTAYTRCTVLDALLRIPHEKIYGFKLDGFITEGNIKFIDDDILKREDVLWTNDKKVNIEFGWGEEIFTPIKLEKTIFVHKDNDEVHTYTEYDKDIFKSRITMLCGAGGTGKSHYILSNMKDVMYISACWRLNVEKMKDYNIKGLSYHQLIGLNCESYL